MKLQIKKGTTSKLLDIFIQDSSSTTGAGLTGLVYNSAGLTAYYYREGAVSATAITLATMTLGTWATGGFVVVDGTNMPGCYQLCIPDAALATGANSVIVMLKGATNMAPLVLEIELVAFDNQTAIAQTGDAYAIVNHGSYGNAQLVRSTTPANTLTVAATNDVSITQAAADKVWSTTSRVLTAGTNIVLAKGVGLTGLNDIVATDVWAAATRTITGGTITTNSDKTGYSLSGSVTVGGYAGGQDPNTLIGAGTIEGSITRLNLERIIFSALSGITNGAGTSAMNFRDNANTKNRIAATLDANGNRTAVTVDGT